MHTELYPLADTIVAIATPYGAGGIGIVRLSGPDALSILQRLMGGNDPNPPAFTPRVLRHGWVHAVADSAALSSSSFSLEPIDEALGVYMPGPASFTGEDVAEVHCHGSWAVLLAVVASACRLGARMAEKGEFTYRAFVNGKYDLVQAEAVAEMIAAPSRQGVRLAQAKLSGLLGRRIEELRAVVEHLRARVALALDFPEEEAQGLDVGDFLADLDTVRAGISALLASYRRAGHWREGVTVLLAGRVNVGKSSLLNALLGRNRAIVSSLPGTTRDFIEETLDLDGLMVRLTDTAGLRESDDPVEKEGVARALELARGADLVLLITEAARPFDGDEIQFLQRHEGRVLLVRNKIDLPAADTEAGSATYVPSCPSVAVSATQGTGLEGLAAAIRSMALALRDGQAEPEHGDVVPNFRQSGLLAAALDEAEALAGDVAAGIACDLFSVRLDAIAMHLAQITGLATTDDLLTHIFSRFCIGK